MKKNIIITGGSGQLGQCLQAVVEKGEQPFNYVFLSSAELDLTNEAHLQAAFERYSPAYCINCAAYTAVDKAEDEQQAAYQINEQAVKALAVLCATNTCVLIHISTDFVFDGSTNLPLTELSQTLPVNVYGKSKLQGEQAIKSVLAQHYIIRTSWLYSEYAHNFCKTMLKLAQAKTELQVIYDQIGTPTYAVDLAQCLVNIINKNEENTDKHYGTYHYSNEGVASWYDFAQAIFEYSKIEINVIPVNSGAFITKAKRPSYSLMDKTKIKNNFGIVIPHWRDSLNRCIHQMYLINIVCLCK